MKNQILEKTEILFWENSFSDLSMDEIAKNIGIKKASLYHYFTSKDVMFLEILEFSFQKYNNFLDELLSSDIQDKNSNFKEKIIKLIKFPYEQKNLFSIVLQKWYCKLDKMREFVIEKNLIINQKFENYFLPKFNLNKNRLLILRSIIDDLWKKYCLINCTNSDDIRDIVEEIEKIILKH